jgi:hypothetical protein
VITTAGFANPPLLAAADGVALRVVTVLATNSGSVVDPRLGRFQHHFIGFPYSSYRVLRRQTRHVAWGRHARFNLPGPGELKVKAKTQESSGVALNVALTGQRRLLVDTDLCLQGRRVLLVGGPRHREGVLIILIGAEGGAAEEPVR